MGLRSALSMLCFLLSGVVAAQGPSGECRGTPAVEPSAGPAELRATAERCPPGPTADLWYNRAYHSDLLRRYRSAMELEVYRASDDARNYHSYRIFIGLSEALARHARRSGDPENVVWLNSIYDRAGEVAEMRLKGYDLQADHLEARLWAE